MDRMSELWRDVGGPGKAPGVSVRAVKNRVNAALDADPGERKVYMKQKLRVALVAAAAVAAITGSALAASENWNVLSAFFRGDVSPAQEYVDGNAYSISDENYTFTVESSVADESTLYVVATVKALNENAREALFAPFFHDMDTFNFYIPAWDEERQTDREQEKKSSGAYGGFGGGEVKMEGEDTRKFQLYANLFGAPDRVELWLGQMGREYSLSIPVTPAPTRTLELNATGTGYHEESAAPGSLTIRRIQLSPFSVRMENTENGKLTIRPRFLFRMADGSIRTQAQMMEFKEGWLGSMVHGSDTNDYVQKYRFYEVQDLDSIASILVFGMEYPLDGSEPFPAEYDPSLEPFTLPQMENYLLPVRALTETLGGACHWDPETGDVKCTYRGVDIVLHPGVDTATVDGRPVKMAFAPEVQNGILAAGGKPFFDAWGVDGFLTHTRGKEVPDPDEPGAVLIETFYHDWYIIP